jgi:hypothetical protein
MRHGRRVTLSWQSVVKPFARGDAEFDEDLPEVPFDGASADEQFRSDLRVGLSGAGQFRDVLFLRGQVVVAVDVPLADLLAGGGEFSACALGERVGADHDELLVGGAQLVACIDASVPATEPLSVEQMGAGEIGPQRCAAEPLDRLGVGVLGITTVADQRRGAGLYARGPVAVESSRCGDDHNVNSRETGRARGPDRRPQSSKTRATGLTNVGDEIDDNAAPRAQGQTEPQMVQKPW